LKGITVVPVGFDPAVVLSAPRLAYPVYMNEEPFKLTERIGRAVVVFDPADDGVALYGNVLVTTADTLQKKRDVIAKFLASLSSSWQWVRTNPESAVNTVKPYYKNVSDAVLLSQIRRTTDFVFFGGGQPGVIDLGSGGRLDTTIQALHAAGSIGNAIHLSTVVPIVTSLETK
jgi:hypothetical protein